MHAFFAHLPAHLPEPLRAAAEETLAAVTEHHHAAICAAQDALEHGGRAAADRYEDAVSAHTADVINAILAIAHRYAEQRH